MEDLSVELVKLLQALLPGFLTAWIFYALTAHRKPDKFERVVQALVFTSIIQVVVILLRELLYRIGSNAWAIGDWTNESQFIWSWSFALLLGLLFSYCTLQDTIHRHLREWGFTTKTSHPTQWFATFKDTKTDIILNMKSGRRIKGWPFEYPDHPDEGQFVLCDASWLIEDKEVSLHDAKFMLIHAAEVELVEFLKLPEGIAEQVEGVSPPCSTE
jgi:hypothetical protein